MSNLAEAVSSYQAALESLPADRAEDAPARVMAALAARDTLARAITASPSSPAPVVQQVSQLDQRLRSSAPRIKSLVGSATLANWRESVQPQPSAWWWSLDALAPDPRPSPLWSVLAALCITVSISLTAEIAQRFLSVGADFVSVFSVLSQAVLTLLAGSTFTAAGQQGVERILSSLGVRSSHQQYWKVGFAVGLLAIVLALRLSLPGIARLYNQTGLYWHSRPGQISGAIDSYRRAISLNPDDAEAHYNLAAAYEDVQQFDRAIAEYQSVTLLDPESYIALNNLARLSMSRRADYAGALALLDAAFDLKPEGDQVLYTLHKNRGWANLGLGYLTLAEGELRQALAIRADGAAAHCLLGQALEKKGDAAGALGAYEDCVGYEANDTLSLEPSWVNLARERLAEEGTQR
jgi:tetratricopeptide (TPR) repeat protein